MGMKKLLPVQHGDTACGKGPLKAVTSIFPFLFMLNHHCAFVLLELSIFLFGLVAFQAGRDCLKGIIPEGSLSGSSQQCHLSTWDPVQFSSVAQLCPTLCNPMNHSTPGLRVHHQLLEFTQTLVHQVSDAIQPSHPLSFPSPPAPNPSQHQGLFQSVSSLHQVAKVLEFQPLHQSFQRTLRTDFH